MDDFAGLRAIPWHWYIELVLLTFGLLLALPFPKRSGLQVGAIRTNWRRVVVVCGGAVLATAVGYPLLGTQPWSGAPVTMWLVSPLAQGLIFIGFLYGRLNRAFPGYMHPGIPVERGLLLTMCFFALWHVPNLQSLPLNYFLLQMFYTSTLALVPALSRQWTGSIWYAVLCHGGVNFIVWYAS